MFQGHREKNLKVSSARIDIYIFPQT